MDLPPTTLAALSKPASLIIIGCGAPELIPMYRRETKTPFPIYADPSRKIYDVLGMTMTLSLGDKNPKYMQRSLLHGSLASIVQGLRTGRHMLSAGNFWQVGGEFLFEADGIVSWCHRMKNTRDHSELDVLRKELQMDEAASSVPAVTSGSKTIGSRRSVSGVGLGHKTSDKRRSWRFSLTRSGHRNTVANGANGSVPAEVMEKLKEEDDTPLGDRDQALATLTGNANGSADHSATNTAAATKDVARPSTNGMATEGHINGTVVDPLTNTAASEQSPPIANGHATEGAPAMPTTEKQNHETNINGNLHNSTPFVQALMNGTLDKSNGGNGELANGVVDKKPLTQTTMGMNGSANGHAVEA